MANNKVDPFVIQWPQKWITDPDTAPTLKYLNRFLHDLWIRSGGGDDFVGGVVDEVNSTTSKAINPGVINNIIDQRFGSGIPLTSDETGFTVDSAALTVDMTEA